MTEGTPLDFLRALRRAGQAVEARMLADLHELGFVELRPGHLTILRHLDLDGSRTTDLARAAGISRQGVSQLAADLEQLGIVEQARDPADGRARIVRYTVRGLDAYRAGVESFERVRAELDTLLGQRSVEQLLGELETVRTVAMPER